MNFLKLLLLATTFYFSNCNAQPPQNNVKDSILSFKPIEQSTDTNTKFNAALTAYLELKNALIMGDATSASSSANSFMTAINAMDMKSMTDKQHSVWMKYVEKISNDVEQIKGTIEIEKQREHFISLSNNFYKVAKVFNTNTEDLYYQFCPMANDGKGAYWISEQSKIRNPYFGNKMLSCGSTKETLPAVKL